MLFRRFPLKPARKGQLPAFATITGESPIYPPRTNNTTTGEPRPPHDTRNENRSSDENRINEQIRVPRVRAIDQDGEMLGVLTTREAILKAQEAGLDLVEISPGAEPPVCKIMDYGKFRYQQQKKKAEARKKQKIIEIKELKLRPSIDDHDLEVKMRAAIRFLEEGDKVKFTLRFRGREMAHQEIGMKLLARVRATLIDKIRIEQEPKFEGNQVIMVVAPAPAQTNAAKPAASSTPKAAPEKPATETAAPPVE